MSRFDEKVRTMEKQVTLEGVDARTADEALSRTEMQIEQEKLKLERERILLERERLEAVRDRAKMEAGLHVGRDGKPSVALSTLVFVSIICLLAGGILGAFSTSLQRDRRSAARLQEVMQTLAPEGAVTNESATAVAAMPAWLKTMKPKGAHSGISLVVIQ
jgi:hypothetical protein